MKMKKVILSITLVIAFTISSFSVALADSGRYKGNQGSADRQQMQSQNQLLSTTSSSIVKSKCVYKNKRGNYRRRSMPRAIRMGDLKIQTKAIIRGLKAKLVWDMSNDTITISKNGNTIKFISDSQIFVNGIEVSMDNITNENGKLRPMKFIKDTLNGKSVAPITTGSGVTTTEPAVTTTEPAVTTTAPAVTTTAPAVTTTEPAVTTTEPAVTTTEPAVTTTAPAVTTTEPAVTTTGSGVTTTEPAVTTTTPSVIKLENLYIPAKAVVNGLKANLVWNKTTDTVTISKNDNTIKFIGDSKIFVNGAQVNMSNIKNCKGKLLPMKFIKETLNNNPVEFSTTRSGVDID